MIQNTSDHRSPWRKVPRPHAPRERALHVHTPSLSDRESASTKHGQIWGSGPRQLHASRGAQTEWKGEAPLFALLRLYRDSLEPSRLVRRGAFSPGARWLCGTTLPPPLSPPPPSPLSSRSLACGESSMLNAPVTRPFAITRCCCLAPATSALSRSHLKTGGVVTRTERRPLARIGRQTPWTSHT